MRELLYTHRRADYCIEAHCTHDANALILRPAVFAPGIDGVWGPDMVQPGCKSVDMRAVGGNIEAVIARRRDIISRLVSQNPDVALDEDHTTARYELYRAFVKWEFRNPLGREKRVRLCDCVVYEIRKMFPSSLCGVHCDYLRECERKHHYVGFRTAVESRATRRGISMLP